MKNFALLTLLACAAVANAGTLTFDDLPGTPEIANGYGDLGWGNFAVMDTVTDPFQNTGYQHGEVSPANVACNGWGDPASIYSLDAVGFTVVDGYFTGAWNDGLHVTASAVFEDHTTATKTFTVDSTHPVDEFFGWRDLASVTFSSAGGTPHPGNAGNGKQFVLDNLTVDVSTVPEPSGIALALAGLGLVCLAARRRKQTT